MSFLTEMEKYLKETTNSDVIQMFVDEEFPTDKRDVWGTKNLKIVKRPNGWSLVNYNTDLLYRDNDGTVKVNNTKYSQSTSKIQREIRYALDEAGIEHESFDDLDYDARLA